MKGSALVKLGLGLLMLWGGFGKLTGIFGPGLAGFSGMLGGTALGGLGESGVYVLAVIVAVVELLAGLVLIGGGAFGCSTCSKYVKKAGWAGALIVLGAVLLVHLPAFDASAPPSWANLMLHIAVILSFLGVATCDSCKA